MTTKAVKVLAFAGARDVLGSAEMVMELDADCPDAGALMDELCRRFPALSAYRAIIRLAVNGHYVELSQPLADGDEVALIPPVAGG